MSGFGWEGGGGGGSLPSGMLQIQGGVPLDTTLRPVTDGMGNVSPLSLSTTQIRFGGFATAPAGDIIWRTNSTLTDYTGWHQSDGNFRIMTKNGASLFINVANTVIFTNGLSARSTINSEGALGLGVSSGLLARLHVRSDGTNPIARFETNAGAESHTFLGTSVLRFGSQGVNISATANGGTASASGRGLLFQGFSGQGIHQFNFVSVNQEVSGTIGGINLVSTYTASANSSLFQPLRIAYSINNTGASTGTATGIFLNATETNLNGMTHNLVDLQRDSVSRFRVSNTGVLTTSSTIISGLNVAVAAGGGYLIAGRGYMAAASDGVWTLYDNAGTSFSRLQFGGTTNAFPAIKRTSAALQVRLADDSNFADFNARQLTTTLGRLYLNESGTIVIARGSGSPEGSFEASVGSIYLRSDGGANTTLYVKESGTGNTGWVAK